MFPCRLIVAGLLVGASPLVAAGVRVSTVELSAPLPSSGRLGGVAVDRRGNVYVANFREAVWRVAPGGEVTLLSSSLRGSSGNAVDAGGNLFQASFVDGRIVRISPAGDVEDYVTEGLTGPVGIAAGAGGELFVCNCRANSISRVDSSRGVETLAEGGDLDCPNGIAIDGAGRLLVVSFNNGIVVEVTRDGRMSTRAEVPGGGNAHIAVVGETLYVSQAASHRVVRIDADGTVTPIAGSGRQEIEDGTGLEASLAVANGLAASADGRSLFVNNLLGPWRGDEPTTVVLRRIDL